MQEMSIGKRIKYLRETMDMTQKEFGEKLGVGRDVISNIELERVPIKEYLIKLICNTYYVSEDWITMGNGEMFDTKDSLVRVVMKNIRNISPKEEKFLTEYFQLPLEYREAFMNLLTKIAKE
jgi:transcriptional regulator with XRE-family HTH domain